MEIYDCQEKNTHYEYGEPELCLALVDTTKHGLSAMFFSNVVSWDDVFYFKY